MMYRNKYYDSRCLKEENRYKYDENRDRYDDNQHLCDDNRACLMTRHHMNDDMPSHV